MRRRASARESGVLLRCLRCWPRGHVEAAWLEAQREMVEVEERDVEAREADRPRRRVEADKREPPKKLNGARDESARSSSHMKLT